MLRHYCHLLCLLLLFSGDALAAGGTQKLVLDPSLPDDQQLLRIMEERDQNLILEFSLPYLELTETSLPDGTYQVLSIPGGDLRGEPGQAALPNISRLIAVPDFAGVQARFTAKKQQLFQDVRIMPVLPEEGDDVSADKSADMVLAANSPPLVTVGAPAILHGLRVVPLTINPVSYDPVTRQITVTSSLEIEIDLSGRDDRNGLAPGKSLVPRSFDQLYRDVVVNYRAGAVETGPGSYLIIAPNDPTVLSELQSLVQWRQRQGYNVVLAHTGQTGTNTTSIKSYILNAFNTLDPPLEFVTLAGDAGGTYSIPCWYETVSGYGGEGDHYYSTLVGGDMLADVHIGRLSFRSLSELQGIVNKILNYEKAPPTTDPGWFTRATLVGDPSSSGITTIFVNQWVKNHLLNLGYTQIDTIWSGNFASLMMSSLNQGETVFGYRGWLNMSGFTSGSASALSNGYELPFVMIPTCGTGSFADDVSCRSEAFLRNPNGGGIGAVGTATLGTHTRYNNCYYMGTWDGALNRGDSRIGVAHSRGKLALYINYINYEPTKVEIWSMWNNLMGDPASPMWTAFPAALDVEHLAVLPLGASSLEVSVTSGAVPVDDALIAIFRDGEIRVTGTTDLDGRAHLPLTDYTAGPLLVTVTKHNFFPYLGSVDVGTVGTFPSLADFTIDDDSTGGSSGNGDGVVNPGETIELPVALRNLGTAMAAGVTANLSSTDPYVSIADATEQFGDIPAGATVWSGEDFDITVTPTAPAGHVIQLDLVATSGASHYNSLIQLPVSSASFAYESYAWSGPGGTLDPGENGTFTVTLRNTGDIAGNGISAVLSTESPWIDVTDPGGSYSNITPGATGVNSLDTFSLDISPECFQGHLAAFTLTLTFNGEAVATTEFTLPVGTASSDDPVGPDGYGYYAFDNTDLGYPNVPTFNWVEIDPNYGGSGTSVGLTDFGWEQDDVETMNLPFTFQFYGQTYNRLSICSNGWISMGVTSLRPYSNRSIPSVGAPPNMIAPYWDNLYQVGTNQVYYYHDAENSRYIVEWSRMRADYNNQTQTVQVILCDPAVYPTSSGDGQILFQYQTVTNGDSRDAYVTVGIQNQDSSDGLLYTYGADYSPGAATLTAGRAILFMPYAEPLNLGTLSGMVTNASDRNTPIEGVSVRVLGTSRTLITQADGTYTGSVQEGIYDVRAEHVSFEPVTVNDVVIQAQGETELNFSLEDVLGPSITNTTNLPYTDDTVGPYTVDTYISDYSSITEKRLYYRVQGGPVQEVELEPVGSPPDHHQAQIPGQPLGSEIEYWIEAADVAGNTSRDPEGEVNYNFWVLETVVAFADNMESDQGWTVGDTGDDATTGIWVRVDPIGVWEGSIEVQPENDATPAPGVLCWITGNNESGTQGADDVDGGKTTLKSPVFDLTESTHVIVSYRRWYTNDTGNSPGEDVWVVEVNNGSGWATLENTNVSERSWALRSFLLDDYIELTATVQFRFIASDEGSGSVVEGGVDEFQLTGFALPGPAPVGEEVISHELALYQNHPNPFNPMTDISFTLPREEEVSLRIFDLSGRLVRTLVQQDRLAAGLHRITWNGRNDRDRLVPSGVYFYRLDFGDQVQTKRMMLVR